MPKGHKAFLAMKVNMRKGHKPFLATKHLSLKKPALYRYTSLDRGEIRLLTLHRGPLKADLQISIEKVALIPDNPPIYEALSYYGGLPDYTVEISANEQRLYITQKLAAALAFLRYKDKPRKLWIDAICINRRDLKERSRQVKRMGDIYKLADRVVGWLGPKTERSSTGVKILEDMSTIKVEPGNQVLEPASLDVHRLRKDVRFPQRLRDFLAIGAVIKRPWFDRLWVQQEIRLAKRDPILLCGRDIIAWKSFCRAISYLHISSDSFKRKWAFSRNTLNAVHNLVTARSRSRFLDIMATTRNCGCHEPRDRVYAVLNLLQEKEALGIQPDYGKETIQVYQDAALRHIAHYKRLDILAFSGQRAMKRQAITWVPDWTVSVADKILSFEGLASGHSVSKYQHDGMGILSVTGSHSATVESASTIKCSTHETTIAELSRHIPLNALGDSYIAGGTLLDAYCATTCANQFRSTYLRPRPDLPHFPHSSEILHQILQSPNPPSGDHSNSTEAQKFLDTALHYCHGASFIKTREGYIGLAPRLAQPRDQICILPGCNWPMLLRPAPDSRHRVVGACYIHGLMHGEAFLGPVPEPYQAVSISDDASPRHTTGFQNHQTKEIQYHDPRVEGLSGHESMSETHPDGSLVRALTAQMLEERGVKLQNFDLV